MKILIVSTNSIASNGVTGVIFNILRSIDKTDMHFDLVAINRPEERYVQEIEAFGGSIFYIDGAIRRKRTITYIKKLSTVIREGKYDMVHAHGNSHTLAFEMIAAKIANCPIRIAHSHNTRCNSLTLHRLLSSLFFKNYTHALACGEDAGRWLFANKPFAVVRNGVCVDKFRYDDNKRRAIREQLGISNECKLIGHVGAFIKQKNHIFLMDLIKHMAPEGENAKLLLIGEGELEAEMKSIVEQYGIKENVIFLGVTDQVDAYMSACDLLVLPSLHEGLPLVLVEAQANGLPCIVSDAVTREADKTGLLTFLPLSLGAEKWAEEIEKKTIEHDRTSVSQLAAEKIKKSGYDIYEEAARLKAYYKKAMEENAGRKHAVRRN